MLKPYIKVKPKWWNFVPWLSSYTANAIYPNIYLPRQVYTNLNSTNPEPKYVAILIHEEAHLNREREIGWIEFGIKYLLSGKFRFEEEIIATKAAIPYQKKHNIPFNVEKRARILSGWLYLWPVSYEYAKQELARIWS